MPAELLLLGCATPRLTPPPKGTELPRAVSSPDGWSAGTGKPRLTARPSPSPDSPVDADSLGLVTGNRVMPQSAGVNRACVGSVGGGASG
jgi:hypothetical protein